MIKGTNQSVIEIHETQSIYYDRAILFLKPEYADKSKSFLEKEARMVVKFAGKPSYIRKEKNLKRILIKSIFIASTIAAMFVGVISLIKDCVRI